MPSLRAFLLPLAMASVMILSNFLLQIVNAQPTQVTTSWIVIESMETFSQSVERLTAKIELQTAALNTLEAKVEMQFRKMEAALKRLESKAEVQATELKGSLAKGDWQEPVPLHFTSRTVVARKDNDVEIWCVVRGTPESEIKWIRENVTLESTRVLIENNGKSLLIKKVQLSDEGTYVCVAANGVGSPASQSVRLQVYGKYLPCHRMIESDRERIELDSSSTSCLFVIKLQNMTGFRVQLDPLMTESILVIPELSPSNTNVQSIRITGSRNSSYEFQGKSLAIVVPPGHERSTISWTGFAPDDSGVLSNTKFMNDFNRTVEWESKREGTDKIFWALDLEFGAELNWTLDAAFAARDQENPCEDVSFSVLQIRPDGNISEIQRTCDGSSEGSLQLEIDSQVLVLLHMKSVEDSRSKLRVSWTRHDEPMEKNVDGIVVGTYGGPIAITFNSTQTKSISSNFIYGVAFDWNSRKIYYLQHKVGITRANLDGTDLQILVSGVKTLKGLNLFRKVESETGRVPKTVDPSTTLLGLTIEPTSGNLYFGNRTSRTIRVCDNDANKCSTIAASSDLNYVYDFAVHRSKGLLFWSIENRKLFRSNLDGSNATVLLERSVYGIHVDEREDRLYWASNNGIGSCDMNGQDIRMVPGVTTYNMGLALDGDNIYYSTISYSIHGISKSGTDSRLVARMSYFVYHIRLFGTRVSNAPWNPCRRSECAHLCVLVTRWSYRCTCPDTQRLDVDGKTCKP